MRMRGLYENLEAGSIMPKVRASTLVIYVFSKTDLEYERNLQFFIQHGMWAGDGCDYAIIVQQVRRPDEYWHPAGQLSLAATSQRHASFVCLCCTL